MTKKAGRKEAEYTVELFFDRGDGSEAVPWGELGAEETEKIRRKMEKNLSSAMSRYYQQHPEALQALG